MWRPVAGLLALALVAASCAPPSRSPPQPPETESAEPSVPEAVTGAATVSPAACRVGPDGGPVLGDRGIGGTGAVAGSTRTADRGIGGTGAASGATAVQSADRGIGGTGTPAGGTQSADRGIGGTGIIGVVTGFASVCLDGREVALDDAVHVLVDGEPAPAAALRAGQLAAIEATGPAAALQARSVAVRHEVSGPVEAVEVGGTLRVAGQRVAVSGETWGEHAPRPGEWVAVSGLRRPDGVIAATRIDPRPPGSDLVTVHGVLLAGPDRALRIGALEVRPAPGIPVAAPGQSVTAFGHYRDGGVLLAEGVTPDVLAEDPVAYFGGGVGVVVLEAYASVGGDGRLRLGRGREFPASPNLGPFAPDRRAIAEFERREDGAFVVTAVREESGGRVGGRDGTGVPPGAAQGSAPRPGPGGSPRGQAPSASAPSRAFELAPVPDRSFDAGGPGFGGAGSGPGTTGDAPRGGRFNAGPPGAGPPGFGPPGPAARHRPARLRFGPGWPRPRRGWRPEPLTSPEAREEGGAAGRGIPALMRNSL